MDEKVSSLMGVSSLKTRISLPFRLLIARVGLVLCVLGLVLWRYGSLWEDTKALGRQLGHCGQVVDLKSIGVQSWSEVKPSSNLVWYRCYDEYDCAKLEVPLDWLDESDPRRATIAMIRYNATDRSDYKGPVFINPGGPGGSGIWYVKHLAPYYQSVVGRNHDIISFDPRGIGMTLPSVDCWNSTYSSVSALLWELQDPPNVDAHPGSVYDAYAYAAAFSRHCADNIGDIGRFVNTPNVARDMLQMIDKLGEDKLQYWGFSYGTFLGTTFAALFPDRVQRLALDGNVDAKEFSSGAGTHFLDDTDAVMNAFYRHCHRAGPLLCAFYANNPEAIEERLKNILADLKIHPVIVPSSPSSNPRPEIVSYSKVRRMISAALYRPLVVFPSLAEALTALENGDGRPFVDLTSQGGEELPLCEKQYDSKDGDPESPTPEVPEAEGNRDATKAIMCTDARPAEGGVEGFRNYVDTLAGMSKAAGTTMSNMWMGCVEWGIKAKWQFRGPYEGNTSHPILFIANTADNVTPLRSALNNAKGFPGSVVMAQDSYGHTTLSMPSRCSALNIRKYFQTGELPTPGTICAPDYLPFERWDVTSSLSGTTDEERELITLDQSLLKLMEAPVLALGH
ncbi:alpha/beta-hydrolase [Mollisia scopiformis]|uniref:Alpha/beta-hydrolase n=1 Tax=Mollisia scopiformis TaxID=149040 RepID=A0A194WYT8_MOLSC|nr:alpha/beta-hydrolase [Mollisia scopiformis]KUJ13110.1 alpha/beta-hydrolase [Mollisia scopiformis]